MLVSILIFLVIFLFLVVSHEYGHYIIGKVNGIHATEFFIGMGPKLIKWKNKEGTEFSIRPFPFGGACVFEGQDALEEEKGESTGHGFLEAPVWNRIPTVLAGPIFNIVLAYLCGVIIAYNAGALVPIVQEVLPQSGAEEAGIMQGDEIVKINGHTVHLSAEVSFASFYSTGEPMKVTVKRNGEKIKFLVTPKYDENDQRYYMGITNGEYVECKGAKSLLYGAYNVEYVLKSTLESLRMIFTGQVGKDDVAGPVGLVKVVDETYDDAKEYGFLTVLLSMINLTMLLSANLAVINLLPLPALDGGRLVFMLVEAIRGKPVPPEKEGYVHLAGMALLLVLVVFVLFNDITRFFR